VVSDADDLESLLRDFSFRRYYSVQY